MAQRVLARDGNGRLFFDGKRFTSVGGAEAKMQLLRERAALQLGVDRFRPSRGVNYDVLKAANATPQAYASAIAQELGRSTLVTSVTATPRGEGVATRPVVGRSAIIDARCVLRGDDEVITLEVALG